jgi:CMP-N-acetylneuraminic acid synthetase
VMDNTGSIDIDSEIDFKFVEYLIQQMVVSL